MKKSISNIIVYTALALFFSLFYRTLILRTSAPFDFQWTPLLLFYLPFVYLSLSLLLKLISLEINVSRRTRCDLLLIIDLLFNAIAFSSAILIVLFSDQVEKEWFLGFFYFAGLLFKTAAVLSLTMHPNRGLKKPEEKFPEPKSAVIFTVAFLFFLGAAGWFGGAGTTFGDEPHYLLITHSMIHDQDMNQYNNYHDEDYRSFYRHELETKPSDIVSPGKIYSQGLGFLFPLLLAPGYIIFGYNGVLIEMCLISAFLALLIFKTCLKTTHNVAVSLGTTAAACLALPISVYSSQVYPDMLAALLTLVGFICFMKLSAGKQTILSFSIIISITAILLFLKFRYAPICCSFALLLILSLMRNKARLLRFSLLIAVIVAVYLSIDYFLLKGDLFFNRFGSLRKISAFLPGSDFPKVIIGLLIDQESGLLFFSPLYILIIPGLMERRKRLKKKGYGEEYTVSRLLVLTLPYIIAISGHRTWHSLPTPPLRYLLPVIPLWIPLISIHAARKYKNKTIKNPLVFMGLFIPVLWTCALFIQPEWRYNFADGANDAIETLGSTLHLSLTQLLPSVVRPSKMTWIWSFVLMLLLVDFILLAKKRKLISIAFKLSLAFLLGLSIIMQTFGWCGVFSSKMEAEDRERITHRGGKVYPYPIDPYFHFQTQYGRELTPGAEILFHLPPGSRYKKMLLSVKSENAGVDAHGKITFNDERTVEFSVQKAEWSHVMIEFHQRVESRIVIVSVDENASSSLFINKIRWFPGNSTATAALDTLADIADFFQFESTAQRLYFSALCYAENISGGTGKPESISDAQSAAYNEYLQAKRRIDQTKDSPDDERKKLKPGIKLHRLVDPS